MDGVLKVRNLSGEWISAVPIPGTFVCNIGDMLKVGVFIPFLVCVTPSKTNCASFGISDMVKWFI